MKFCNWISCTVFSGFVYKYKLVEFTLRNPVHPVVWYNRLLLHVLYAKKTICDAKHWLGGLRKKSSNNQFTPKCSPDASTQITLLLTPPQNWNFSWTSNSNTSHYPSATYYPTLNFFGTSYVNASTQMESNKSSHPSPAPQNWNFSWTISTPRRLCCLPEGCLLVFFLSSSIIFYC